jgi:hypothetical protein
MRLGFPPLDLLILMAVARCSISGSVTGRDSLKTDQSMILALSSSRVNMMDKWRWRECMGRAEREGHDDQFIGTVDWFRQA